MEGKKEDCVFCRIAKGESIAHKIYEDEEFLAFLDAFPTMRGQVIVIPKEHKEDYIFMLQNQDYTKLMLIVKKTAKAIDKAMRPIKTGIIIEGLEIAHVHVKLYPLTEGLGLKPMKEKISDLEMQKIANKIGGAVE